MILVGDDRVMIIAGLFFLRFSNQLVHLENIFFELGQGGSQDGIPDLEKSQGSTCYGFRIDFCILKGFSQARVEGRDSRMAPQTWKSFRAPLHTVFLSTSALRNQFFEPARKGEGRQGGEGEGAAAEQAEAMEAEREAAAMEVGDQEVATAVEVRGIRFPFQLNLF